MAIIFDKNKKVLSQNVFWQAKLAVMSGMDPKDVVIIDPEQEYKTLAETLGGEVIRIEVTPSYINPLDVVTESEET